MRWLVNGELTVGKLCSRWRVPNRMDSDILLHLHLNSDKTQFIWVGSRQQLASVSVAEIVLNGFSIKTSPIVTCLGVEIDAELTFSTHVKQISARCFYQLRQMWSIRPALTSDNAIMLTHALITSRVEYCNSVLFQTAAVHLRPLQSVMNAAARLVVKKRKSDNITPTLRDTLYIGSWFENE